MGKIKIALAWALGFIGEDRFYRGFAFLATLAVKWAVKRRRYAWLRGFAGRVVKFCTAILNATEDGEIDAMELEAIVAAGKALAVGNIAGDNAILDLIDEQEAGGPKTGQP